MMDGSNGNADPTDSGDHSQTPSYNDLNDDLGTLVNNPIDDQDDADDLENIEIFPLTLSPAEASESEETVSRPQLRGTTEDNNPINYLLSADEPMTELESLTPKETCHPPSPMDTSSGNLIRSDPAQMQLVAEMLLKTHTARSGPRQGDQTLRAMLADTGCAPDPPSVGSTLSLPLASYDSSILSLPSTSHGSNTSSLPSTSHGSNTSSLPSTSHGSNTLSLPSTSHGSNTLSLPSTSHGSNTLSLPSTSHGSNTLSLPSTSHGRNRLSLPSTSHGSNMLSLPSTSHGSSMLSLLSASHGSSSSTLRVSAPKSTISKNAERRLHRLFPDVIESIRDSFLRNVNNERLRSFMPILASPLVHNGLYLTIFPEAGSLPYYYYDPVSGDMDMVPNPDPSNMTVREETPSALQRQNPTLSSLLRRPPILVLSDPVLAAMVGSPYIRPPKEFFTNLLINIEDMARGLLKHLRKYLLRKAYRIISLYGRNLANEWKKMDEDCMSNMENEDWLEKRRKTLTIVHMFLEPLQSDLAAIWDFIDPAEEFLDHDDLKIDLSFFQSLNHLNFGPIRMIVYNVTEENNPANPDPNDSENDNVSESEEEVAVENPPAASAEETSQEAQVEAPETTGCQGPSKEAQEAMNNFVTQLPIRRNPYQRSIFYRKRTMGPGMELLSQVSQPQVQEEDLPQPVFQQPVIQQPAVQQPVVQQPVVQESEPPLPSSMAEQPAPTSSLTRPLRIQIPETPAAPPHTRDDDTGASTSSEYSLQVAGPSTSRNFQVPTLAHSAANVAAREVPTSAHGGGGNNPPTPGPSTSGNSPNQAPQGQRQGNFGHRPMQHLPLAPAAQQPNQAPEGQHSGAAGSRLFDHYGSASTSRSPASRARRPEEVDRVREPSATDSELGEREADQVVDMEISDTESEQNQNMMPIGRAVRHPQFGVIEAHLVEHLEPEPMVLHHQAEPAEPGPSGSHHQFQAEPDEAGPSGSQHQFQAEPDEAGPSGSQHQFQAEPDEAGPSGSQHQHQADDLGSNESLQEEAAARPESAGSGKYDHADEFFKSLGNKYAVLPVTDEAMGSTSTSPPAKKEKKSPGKRKGKRD